MTSLPVSCALIFGIAIAGGVIPLALRRTDRVQHLMIAFAAGVFLSVVFTDLLPWVGAKAAESEHEHVLPDGSSHVHGDAALIWFFVLLGVVLLFLIENLAFRRDGHLGHAGATEEECHERHRTVGWATLFGLSVHAFTAGLALGVTLSATVLFAILSHKAVEGFSLGAAFLLAGMRRRQVLTLIIAFAVVTPAGALIGSYLVTDSSGLPRTIFTALAAGTFLFVALCDLLPEVFHHKSDLLAKIGLLAAGIAVEPLLHLLAE